MPWGPLVSTFVFIFCILILGTISGIFSERVGIVNIAINGFMIFGAIMYMILQFLGTHVFAATYENKKVIGHAISMWWQVLIIPLAALLTGLFGFLFGYTTIKLKSNQVVSGFAINILAIGLAAITIYILRKYQDEGQVVSNSGTVELALGQYPTIKNIVSFKLFITIAIIIASWFVLRKTRWGLRYRSIGENPQASDVAGINVYRMKWIGLFICGCVAGVGGSIFATLRLNEFSTTADVQGIGFLALAIMITGQWKISISTIISLIFAALYSFSYFGISSFDSIKKFEELFRALPFVVTLIVLFATSKKSAGPAAAGVAYDKSKR